MNDNASDKNADYALYKPLRNYLRQFSLTESLYALWNYARLLQFNKKPNSDMLIPAEYQERDSMMFKGHVHPWEIDIMAKESIINCEEITSKKTLRIWNYLADGVNKLKAFENKLSDKYISENNVLQELIRISHRQFVWESRYPQPKLMVRYYKLFSTEMLSRIIERKIGISAKKLYIVGTVLTGAFVENIARSYPVNVSIKQFTVKDFDLFFQHFSKDLGELKKILLNEQQYNEKFPYAFNSLHAFPLIKMDYRGSFSLVCPIPTLLFWRFTDGIYYEICGESGFDAAFGDSFQKYVGEVILKCVENNKVIAEDSYKVGKRKEFTVDWIINDKDAALFIECKAKRLVYSAKVEILSANALESELEKMSEMILQIYKTIHDYKEGHYKKLSFDLHKKIFPMLITLENWYFFGNKFNEILDSKLQEKFNTHKLPIAWLQEMPYSICSIEDFEDIAQVIGPVGVEKFMYDKLYDKDMRMWMFDAYIRKQFPEKANELKDLFMEDWDNLYNEYL